jgi:hypothetical protein
LASPSSRPITSLSQENNVKKLQVLLATLALTGLLSVSTPAGVMTTGIAQPSPTPTTSSAVTEDYEAEAHGTMSTGVESPEPLTEVAVSLVQSLLALF